MAVLVALRIDEHGPKYKSFLHAVKTTWNTKKISQIKQRLDEIRTELHFRIQLMVKADQVEMEVKILQSLDEASRHVLTAVLQTKKDVVRQQQASDHLAAKRHDEMIAMMGYNPGADFTSSDVANKIEELLQHEKQNDRFDDIVTAHQATFRWALQEQNSTTESWPNLHKWLQRGSGIYWISGKAGSGKSTLMKFLHQDKLLQASLTEWAGDSKLVMVHFYFWNTGSDLQKSQEGLLRGLLHQVLDQEPSLGPELFQEQFKLGKKWVVSAASLTFHQIRRAFNRLATRRDSSIKIALLIDGLDEFDANDLTMTELAEMFIAITKSSNIKALVSSRPLAPFEYSFAHYPKLRLHNLTYEDISKYVNDRLATHSRIATLAQEDADGTKALIDEIVISASGVFLWVKLVVRSLLEGLQNFDKLPDLQRRLRELPHDLEDLFRHMLHKIPTEYKVDSSQVFQIFRRSEEYDGGTFHTTALAFSEMDEAQVLAGKIEALTSREIQRYEEEVAGRLRSRCAGLLEVRPRTRESEHPVRPFSSSRTTMYVDYLHKSVADFLSRKEIWDEVTSHSSGTDFDANLALLRSIVMQIKHSLPHSAINMSILEVFRLVRKAMHFARLAEASAKTTNSTLLNELDRAMLIQLGRVKSPENLSYFHSRTKCAFTPWCRFEHTLLQKSHKSWRDDFLSFAIGHGLSLYVQGRLKMDGQEAIQKQGRPLLDLACFPKRSDPDLDDYIRADIVASLLQYGADPNQVWQRQGKTAWQNALVANPFNAFEWVAVLRNLVSYGADLNAWSEYEQRNGNGKRNRKSPLRVLRMRDQIPCEANFCPEMDSGDGLCYETPILVPVEDQQRFAVELESLIQLLVAKGAIEGEWHEAANGIFEKVYPTSSAKPQSRTLQSFKNIENKTSSLTRNPLERMFRRLHRPQPGTS
jgi:DNA replication protein DnaC